MKILVFIPTYNDFDHLNGIIDEILDLGSNYTVLVIDDGSSKSEQIDSRCLKVTLPFNLGLGVATHIAIDHALQFEYDIVLRVDADGQHSTDDIQKLIAPILNDSADLSIETRINRHEGKSFRIHLTRIASRYFRFLSKLIFHKTAPEDLNSGFMAYNRKAVSYLNQFELERYPEPQIVLYALEGKLYIKSIDIEQNPRMSGTSSINLWHATMLLFRVIFCFFNSSHFSNSETLAQYRFIFSLVRCTDYPCTRQYLKDLYSVYGSTTWY
jgi:glycosyltransferase involved in cell wall biosynthesis